MCVYDDLKKCICGISLDILFDVLPFLHACVLKLIEEMVVSYLSTLCLWPQFVDESIISVFYIIFESILFRFNMFLFPF